MTSEYHYDRGWTTDVAPYCEACREAFPCQPFLVEQVNTLTAERDRYREALERVANLIRKPGASLIRKPGASLENACAIANAVLDGKG